MEAFDCKWRRMTGSGGVELGVECAVDMDLFAKAQRPGLQVSVYSISWLFLSQLTLASTDRKEAFP